MGVACNLRKARGDHRRHADDRPGRQIDAAHDDDLRDADSEDADLRLLHYHDLEAEWIGDEALPDENPTQDLEQQHHAEHNTEDAELRWKPSSGSTCFRGWSGGRDIGSHGGFPLAFPASPLLLRRELHNPDLGCVLTVDNAGHAPLVHDEDSVAHA